MPLLCVAFEGAGCGYGLGMAVTVRAARPDDVPEILSMVRELAEYERALHDVQATEHDLTAALFGAAPAVFCHVAEDDGPDGQQTAGFVLWFLNFSTWLGRHGIYVEDLYVRPQFRGHGYGRLLLEELARTCVERGHGRLEWCVLDWNEPALGFYRSLGATAMDDWTVYRLSGDSLDALGAIDPGPPSIG